MMTSSRLKMFESACERQPDDDRPNQMQIKVDQDHAQFVLATLYHSITFTLRLWLIVEWNKSYCGKMGPIYGEKSSRNSLRRRPISEVRTNGDSETFQRHGHLWPWGRIRNFKR